VQAVFQSTKGQVVAVDGKTFRRSHDQTNNKKAIHVVSAWATANHLVLAQQKVDEKSNEITAIPELLRLLDISGCIITIDAMGAQTEIAEQIIAQEADYLLAIKDTQPHLHEDMRLFFRLAQENNFQKVESTYHRTVNNAPAEQYYSDQFPMNDSLIYRKGYHLEESACSRRIVEAAIFVSKRARDFLVYCM
jgi:predicted transposase YbfD/YdcC